jgi:hypothetical protein
MGSSLPEEIGQDLTESAQKGIAAAPKVSYPSLSHLWSYARIAVQITGFSPALR